MFDFLNIKRIFYDFEPSKNYPAFFYLLYIYIDILKKGQTT